MCRLRDSCVDAELPPQSQRTLNSQATLRHVLAQPQVAPRHLPLAHRQRARLTARVRQAAPVSSDLHIQRRNRVRCGKAIRGLPISRERRATLAPARLHHDRSVRMPVFETPRSADGRTSLRGFQRLDSRVHGTGTSPTRRSASNGSMIGMLRIESHVLSSRIPFCSRYRCKALKAWVAR